MHASVWGLLAVAGLASAIPFPDEIHVLETRASDPGNTCGSVGAGANKNYTCSVAAGNSGPCCSGSGWCGSTTDYCGSGCQTAFGTCNAAAPPAPVTNTYMCGPTNGGLSCTGGLCCSSHGYCGSTTDYCSTGCQAGYGACTANTAPTTSTTTCGPSNGGTICNNNQCCSVGGYCGTTEEYCSDPYNCAYGYGRCDSSVTPAGPTTQNVARPLLGSISYTNDIIDCVANNVVALSFDDGPYLYTAQLLDLLKTYGFKATFFITGNNNGRGAIDTTSPYPSIIQRMIAEGHQVASHTWSHYSLDNSTSALRISQMVKNEMALNNIIGKWPTYMRPPFSQCQTAGCTADMQSLGYHRILFDLDTTDYLNPLPTQIQSAKDVVNQALKVPGVTDYLSIQHDIVQQSVTNLSSYYFDLIKAKGWKGVTVGDCLGDPQANWYRTMPSTTATTSKPVSVASISTATSTPASTTTAAAVPVVAKSPVVAQCDLTVNNFCGSIATFTTAATCNAAVTTCNAGYLSCVQQNGFLFFMQCMTWMTKCQKLSTYCKSCGATCSNAGFGLS